MAHLAKFNGKIDAHAWRCVLDVISNHVAKGRLQDVHESVASLGTVIDFVEIPRYPRLLHHGNTVDVAMPLFQRQAYQGAAHVEESHDTVDRICQPPATVNAHNKHDEFHVRWKKLRPHPDTFIVLITCPIDAVRGMNNSVTKNRRFVVKYGVHDDTLAVHEDSLEVHAGVATNTFPRQRDAVRIFEF
eukprot:CAMPEP_0194509532 /NCGR_PEP_ID=MMETSP0253-20130528/40397_1 /TAXON_ID=2966 /ORGANISM="Noctiluca scintillans" /LENGTH=187 /DNA_ID=CAMNT_0039352693 /DNA_START=927 /DNA_END=1487 /DNA_ORIENTATION=+